MKTLQELLEEAKAILAEMAELQGKVEAEEDEAKGKELGDQLAAKEVAYKSIEGKIEQATTALERKQKLAAVEAKSQTQTPGDVAPKVPAQAKDERKDQLLQEQLFVGYLQGKDLSAGEHAAMMPKSKNFKEGSAGVVIPPHLHQAFFGKRFSQAIVQGKALISTSTEHGETSLIPEDYRKQLLMLPFEPEHILGMATIIPSTTGEVTLPRLVQTDANEYGGMSFEIIEEGTDKPETQPEFEQVKIATHEVAGYTEISIRMLARSAIALEALLARLYRPGIRAFLDNLFLNGTGTNQPLGIINTAGIRVVARGTAGDVTHDDLVRLKHAVLPHHRGSARFMIHDDVELGLELKKDTQKRPLFSASTADGPRNRLVGYPYGVTLRQPGRGTAGDVIFGDFSEYAVAVEEEVVIKRSEHYKFRQNLMAFVVYCVMGGRLWQPRAMAILGPRAAS